MENIKDNQNVSVQENLNLVWKMMEDKGLTLSERIQIRKVISEWSQQNNPDIIRDNKDNLYSHKNVKGYCFETEEEAEFIGAMVKFIPNADIEKIIQVMSMVLKLFDIESAWTWKGVR